LQLARNEILRILRQIVLMETGLTALLGLLLKAGAVFLVFNEVRGLILAGPVIYGIYASGGTAMAIWVGFCSLGGIALSVIVPLVAAQRLKIYAERRLGTVSQAG
jgi:hypothetical protein